ncbi:cell division control protein 7 [Pancytospora epiphaga]|nr:cell division control protein 7 [Pancytospora epiphaga]
MSENLPPILPKYLEFMKENYDVLEQIGEGTFSTVYLARCRKTGMFLAIKCITKTSAPGRVLDELMIIKKLEGQNNCIRLLRAERDGDQIIAVFPLVLGTDFKEFITHCSLRDIRIYMYNLLTALAHTHANSVIHRDLKPSNFIYNMDAEVGVLIDFGLAQHEKKPQPQKHKNEAPVLFFNSIVVPSKPPGYYQNDSRPPLKAPRAGTRGFRAPEVLFRSEYQTCAIDMWSIGVIFLSILTTQYPFFLSIEDMDNLVEIALIFGHSEMRRAAKLYGRTWKSNLPTIKEERMPFQTLIQQLNPSLVLDDATYSLLDGLLDLNCHTRLTAKEALEHPFFRSDDKP